MDQRSSRILVTGASGFVGASLTDLLSKQGHDVVGTTTSVPGNDTVYCNIEDRGAVTALIHQLRPEIVIHCAAISSVTAGRPIDYYRVNTIGTENLLEAFCESPDRRRFVFISTAGVYGNQDEDVLGETLCPKPVHHYGMSKFCAERAVQNCADRVDYTIVRPFNIIGEGQNDEFIVPKLVDAFHRKARVVRLGNIGVYRDYVDINDASAILASLAFRDEARNETVNLCSGRPVSLKDLIATLEEVTDHTIEVEVAPEFVRRNEVWRLLGDQRKLQRLLGESPRIMPMADTLRRMLARKGGPRL